MPDPEAKSERTTLDPKSLTLEYHKARKQLMLWSGILFVWELVGIDLDKAKETEGTLGALLKSIKSPQAVPWILLIMVAYFLFRFNVEWNQSDARRRLQLWARIDFLVAWIVALAAYALHFYQVTSKVQVAKAVQDSPPRNASVALGFTVGMILVFCLSNFVPAKYGGWESARREKRWGEHFIELLVPLLLPLAILIVSRAMGLSLIPVAIGKGLLFGVGGGGLGFLGVMGLHILLKNSLRKTPSSPDVKREKVGDK